MFSEFPDHNEGTTLMRHRHDCAALFPDSAYTPLGARRLVTKRGPFATASVVLLGIGLVAITPVAGVPVLPDVQSPAVLLTDAWTDVFNTTSANATTLLNNFFEAPGVALQQAIANQAGFAQQVLDDPSNINAVTEQFQENLHSVLTGYGLQNADSATTATVLAHTLDHSGLADGHLTLFGEIPGYLPADEVSTITPIINFLASPASGIIMGELGPLISPWVALMNSISDGDTFSDTLTNMVGAFFNGADLNLDSLLTTINGLGLFPAGMAMTNLDIAFGGLLSTGGVGLNSLGVGGSIFNSVGIDFSGVPAVETLDAPSQAIGPLGAWEGWAQTIAALIGWDGSGSPLAGVTLPLIPDDGGAAASAASDAFTWLQDLVSAL